MIMKINNDDCMACGTCKEFCPNAAIENNSGTYEILPEICIGCVEFAPKLAQQKRFLR